MKKVIRLTESDLIRLVKRVINEQIGGHEAGPVKMNGQNNDVCAKFVEMSKNQFINDVNNLKFSSGGDTEIAKNLVSKSKKIYKFNGPTSEANKNLSCIGLTLYKSNNYDFYEPKLGGSNYFYIGVW
jgi:hypothetical protein